MGSKSIIVQGSLRPAFFGSQHLHGTLLSQRGMVGTQGCSGGRRPGAGRKPGSTQIKNTKSKGIKKASKSGQAPPDANIKKLTAFFSIPPAAAAAGDSKNCMRNALAP